MENKFKITTSKMTKQEIIEKINNYKNEIIDLSDLNLFEAAKTVIMISTYGINKNCKQKYKYKVTQNVQNLLSEIPLSNMVEFV